MTTSEPTTDTEPDEILAAALAEHGSPLTGDQYVKHVLLVRQSAWIEEHRAAHAARGIKLKRIFAPLLPDFVRDADTPHVQVPDQAPEQARGRRVAVAAIGPRRSGGPASSDSTRRCRRCRRRSSPTVPLPVVLARSAPHTRGAGARRQSPRAVHADCERGASARSRCSPPPRRGRRVKTDRR